MNVTTMAMPRQQARKLFLEYRSAVRERHDAETTAIMRAYRQLSLGNQVVDLVDTMRHAGLGPDEFPRLAIARADATSCHVHMNSNGSVSFGSDNSSRWLRSKSRMIDLPSICPSFIWENRRRHDAEAMVPIVPPQFRPASKLENYHVLWEANWSPIPPRDPVLLRRLGAHFYAVVAVWDLTAIERAAIGAR